MMESFHMQKEYLGDAVYAEIDKFGDLVLTTENGECATNTVILEPQIILALDRYLKTYRSELRDKLTDRIATEGKL